MDHICQFVNGNSYCDSNDKRYKAKLHRKIHQTKKKVKPKLTSEEKGWHKLNYTNTLNLSSKEINENIVCVDRNILTAQEFREKFEIKTSTPVIMLNDQKYWLAHKKWKLSRLKLKYRNQLFRCGNDENGFSVKIKLMYFIDYLLCNTDDAPLYIFDGSIKNNTKSSRLLEDYIISDYFNEDLFSILGDEKRPPFRWFVMVPPRSGTNIHLDPLGGKVSVPGIYGDITVDIPKASNSRGRIRLPGKGIARVNSFGYGDHYLYLSIAAPRRLTNVQRAISDGVEIVVATPGRLSDLVASGVFALNNCRFLVLDECVVLLAADNKQMLTELHTALPKVGPSGERLQVIVCSATLHSFEVNKLADAIMQFPQWVDLKGEDSVPDTVHHLVCMVDPTADKSWQTRLSSDARFLDGVYAEDRLSQAIENRELQLGQLERQWADHKAELTGHIATVRAGRMAGMARTRQLEERLGEVRGQMDECRADYQQKEAEIRVLDDKVKHVLTTSTRPGGGSTAQSRGDFTKRILELTENRKKQAAEVRRILADIFELHRELNSLRGKLERCFADTSRCIGSSAKRDEAARRMHRVLLGIHDNCASLVAVIEEKGRLLREVRELETSIAAEDADAVDKNLARILADHEAATASCAELKRLLKSHKAAATISPVGIAS